jgi:Ca-activated chloride channel family protein
VLRHILILGLSVAVQTLPAQAPAVEASQVEASQVEVPQVEVPQVDVPQEPFKLSTTAELVLLDVSVESPAGTHIPGLTKNDFRVYEDGKLQTVSHFANEDVPVTAGLVIDMSGSMRAKRAEVVTAALALIGASNPSDEIFVVHFSDGVSLGLPADIPFTGDIKQLSSALWRGKPEGRTALNDAMVLSLKHLEQGRRDRRTLVLVSDGGDNSSVHKADEVMRMVLESRATIYTIGIFDESDPDRNPGLLRHLAEISGGESFLNVQLDAVMGICRQIASDIRARYTIGYIPVRSGERGSLRKIKVTAFTTGGHKLVVHTRTGYVLPPQRPSADRDGEPGRKRGL